MGAVSSTRKLSMEIFGLLEELEPSIKEIQAKAQTRERIQEILVKLWPTCRVIAFGSSESGFGFGGSDLDIGIYFEDVPMNKQGDVFSPEERLHILIKTCAALNREFQVTQFIQNARVPILKLWDPKAQVSCDICVGGTNALLNTAYLKYYGRIDPRVRPLALAIKYWAMQRGINDSANGTLSSYGFAMLLIFYLQSNQANGLLPVIHSVFEKVRQEQTMTAFLAGLKNLPICDTGMATYGEISEQQSVGALLGGFFRFYASEFKYKDHVVSVRTGSSQFKTTKWDRSVPWRLSIEDPFELTHDVGRVVFHQKGHELIMNKFKRAYQLLLDGNSLEEVCSAQKDAWYINASCYICQRVDHKARECARFTRANVLCLETNHLLPNTATIPECWYCGDFGHVKMKEWDYKDLRRVH